MYTIAILLLLLATLAEAQWNVPIGGANYNPLMAGGQLQPTGGFYGSPLSNQPANSQLAAQFAPQFAQFGTQYPGYGGQSNAMDRYQSGQITPNMPMDTSRLFPASQSTYGLQPGLQPMGFPNQPRPIQQLIHQPGAFGPYSAIQGGPTGPMGYGGGMQRGYISSKGDDFMGNNSKTGRFFRGYY
ncbi:hypothetical protein OSTOST_14041 [Ostertagia ostertagi]